MHDHSTHTRKKESTSQNKEDSVSRKKSDNMPSKPSRCNPRREGRFWLSDLQAIEALLLAQMKSAEVDDVDSYKFEYVDEKGSQWVEMW